MIDASSGFIGLFTEIGTGADISNLTLSDFNISGDIYVGALAGAIKHRQNVTIQGINLTSASVSGLHAGGLIGNISDSQNILIEDIYKTNMTILGVNPVGGILGSVVSNSILTIRNITSLDLMISGNMDIGGMIGFINNSTVDILHINQRADIVSTSSSNSNIGGIVGDINTGSKVTLDQVTHRGIVSGAGLNVGGVMGSIESANASVTITAIEITNSHVQGSDNVGGILGLIEGTSEGSSRLIGTGITIGVTQITASGHFIGTLVGQVKIANAAFDVPTIISPKQSLKLFGSS